MTDLYDDEPTCPICSAPMDVVGCDKCFGEMDDDDTPCDQCDGRTCYLECTRLPHSDEQMATWRKSKKEANHQ